MSHNHKRRTILTANQRAKRCVLSLEQAVYQAHKSNRGVIGEIAEVYGENYNTLSHQVNPNRTSHTLDPHTIELMLERTQDGRILDAVCCAHGNAGWFLLPDANSSDKVMNDLGDLGHKFADMTSTILDAYADKIIDQDEYDELHKVGLALIGQTQAILEAAKQNMESNDVNT